MREKRDIYQDVTDRIIQSLERGVVPWRQPWSSTGASAHPRNVRTGKPYRGINIFLLGLTAMLEGYSDPRWGTFNALRAEAVSQARRSGREIVEKEVRGRKQFYEVIDGDEVWFDGGVRKGEKGTSVILWKPIPKRDAEPNEDGSQPMTWLLRGYTVFNVEQAEGIEIPTPELRPEHERIEAAEAIINGYVNDPGPTVKYGGDRAFYSLLTDKVTVPVLEQFIDAPHHYGTTFHELVHSTGHESRLKRIEPALFGSDPYAKEELVAEMGAAMLAALAGIDTDTVEESASYIDNWLTVLKADKKFVVSAAAQAQKAADLIVGTTFDDEEGSTAEAEPVLAGVS